MNPPRESASERRIRLARVRRIERRNEQRDQLEANQISEASRPQEHSESYRANSDQENQVRERIRQQDRRINATIAERTTERAAQRNAVQYRRQNESLADRAHRLERARSNQVQRLASESSSVRESRLESLRANQAIRLANESLSARDIRLESLRNNQTERLAIESSSARDIRLESLRNNQAERLAIESSSARDIRLESLRRNRNIRIADESPEARAIRLEASRNAQYRRLANESPEARDTRVNVAYEATRMRREAETELQHSTRIRCSAARHMRSLALQREIERKLDSDRIDEQSIVEYYLGSLNAECQFCKSLNFTKERPTDGKFNSCCHKGKVKLPEPGSEYPETIRDLLTNPSNPQHSHFMEYIRNYCSAVAFASFGAAFAANVNGRGPYCFRAQGQIYHLTPTNLQPANNELPRYAQLYVLDPNEALNARLQNPNNSECRQEIFLQIEDALRPINRIMDSYVMMKDYMQQQEVIY